MGGAGVREDSVRGVPCIWPQGICWRTHAVIFRTPNTIFTCIAPRANDGAVRRCAHVYKPQERNWPNVISMLVYRHLLVVCFKLFILCKYPLCIFHGETQVNIAISLWNLLLGNTFHTMSPCLQYGRNHQQMGRVMVTAENLCISGSWAKCADVDMLVEYQVMTHTSNGLIVQVVRGKILFISCKG